MSRPKGRSVGVKPFDTWSEEEAASYAEAYLAALPAKVEALRARIAATGGDPALLDGTPDSLEPLWRWFVDWYDRGGPTEPAELPEWYDPDPAAVADQRLTPATLQVVDGMGAYLAGVLRARVPDLEWVVVRSRGRVQDAHQNQPVLRGSVADVNPRHVAQALATRVALWGEGRHPTAMRETFEAQAGPEGIA